jgi:hypothetical protein
MASACKRFYDMLQDEDMRKVLYSDEFSQRLLNVWQGLIGKQDERYEANLNYFNLLQQGDYVILGAWEQDPDHMGAEPILWQVRDQEDGNGKKQRLLICEYALLQSAWNTTLDATDPAAQTWENSDVRALLNGTFYEQAFSEKEKALIEKHLYRNDAVLVANHSSSVTDWYVHGVGPNTEDYVTIFSPLNLVDYTVGTLSPWMLEYHREWEVTPALKDEGSFTGGHLVREHRDELNETCTFARTEKELREIGTVIPVITIVLP